MDFNFTEEQHHLKESARKFARKELVDVAKELEEADEPMSEEWRKRLGAMGFLGVNIPQAYGGLGLTTFEAVLVLEELAQISPAVAFPVFESCFGPTQTLLHCASEDIKQKVLPRVCTGELVVAVTMSEPEAGSAMTDLTTRGVIQGDKVIINGQKRWCSGAGHSGGYLLYCRMSDARGAAGVGAIYLELGTKGMSFGKRERLLGMRGVPSRDIFFDDAEVPAKNIVVPVGKFKDLMKTFSVERCGNTTLGVAGAAAALEYAVEYVQTRKQFGKPIVEFQAVQLRLADMAIRVEAARLLLYRAAANAAAGIPSLRDISIAKCYANEITREVCANGVQLMGAYGFNKEYGMEQRLRDSFAWGIGGGTIDIQKINIAAELVGRRFDQRR
ncbi:MAG: acyl-CoA dehydrogenase [Betaproteobacteria bacterium]|nr:MAG: acyl-CoA dehydrogenase [Betaproteobacteria bacterium]